MDSNQALTTVIKAMQRVLIVKDGDAYRPVKGTSRQDAYRALYEIQEALGTNRIYGIGEEHE